METTTARNAQWWADYNERQLRLSIRRTLTRFVVEGGRTLKVAGTYLPYVLAMQSEGLLTVMFPFQYKGTIVAS